MGKYLASLLIIREGNQPRDREMVVEDLSPDPRGGTSQPALLDLRLLWKTISLLLSQLPKVNPAVSLLICPWCKRWCELFSFRTTGTETVPTVGLGEKKREGHLLPGA